MRRLPYFLCLAAVLGVLHCSKIEELGSRFFTKSGAVSANVTVTGITGQGLIIKINDQLQSVTSSSVSFATNLVNGDSYTVSVATQPILPTQICAVSGAATAVAAAGQINIAINCTAPPAWAIQGTTTGYAGSGLQVQLNGGEILNVTTASFAFATNVSDNQQYNVQVKTQPTSPAQICTAQRNVGLVTGANVTDVSINCSTVTFSVGGFITGLAGGASVTLQVNGTQNTVRASDGFFTFTNKLADQTIYSITVLTQPTGQICSVGNGAGILDGQGSYASSIQCSSTTHTISGTLSGLSGGYTTLVASTGEFLPVTANGAFSFTKNFATNSNYVIEVFRNPAAPAQTCTVANGTGTITSNISNVTVSCTANGYSIGGTSTVSGLTSSGLVLRLNGSSDVLVPANATSFSFNETVADGSSYTVTIAAQPAGQKCTLSNATGTAGAAVTNVTVSCVNGYTVGGTVTGYTGSNLVLRNTINGTPLDLVISSNSTFTFPGLLVGGDTYAVSIANYPETPYQNCSITSGSGTVAAANITNISITCTNVTLAFTAVSSNPTEAVGVHNISLSLSGTTPRAGSVDIVISGGSATNTLDYTLTATTISWNALATPGNVVANIIDDAFNEGSETIQISLSNPVGITLGAQTTHTVTITDNDAASAVGAVITAAEYYDADRNGKIDYVKITFDKAVKDSSQVGWVNATTNISVSPQWLIAGYTGVQFVPQVCIDRSIPANGNCSDGGDITDVVDNNVIWLKFTEGSSYDTGATPDLTGVDVTLKTVATSPNDCYIYTSGATCQTVTSADFSTGAVAEADKAEPVLIAAWSDPIIDAWQLRLQFSEAVDLSAGVGACAGTVTNAAFTYTDVSGSGTSALRTDFADNNGCDSASGNYYIIPRVNARFTNNDLYPSGNADTLALASTFYDSLGNASIATTKTITYDPYLELYYPMDAASPLSDGNSVVHDVSGKARDGSVANGAKRVRDMTDTTYQAYYFDGNDDRITPASFPALGTGAFTVSAWVYLTGQINTHHHQIVWWGSGATNQAASFGLQNGKLAVGLWGGASVISTVNSVDGWHHVAATYSGGSIQLYVDGLANASGAFTPNLTALNPGIGYYPIAPTTETLQGKLDEVRLYSRTLNATEIRKLAVKVPSGLVAQYPLEPQYDTANATTVDFSGNGNDMTIGSSAGADGADPVASFSRYFSSGSSTSYTFVDASNDYTKTASSQISLTGASFTAAGWAKRSATSTGVDYITSVGIGSSAPQRFALMFDSDNTIYCSFLIGNALQGPAVTDLNWHHIACTYDQPSKSRTIYLDGAKVASDVAAADLNVTSLATIGAAYDGTAALDARANDIRYYNRALSAGEVKALATELDRGLVAYYTLDDNVTSGTVLDFSGSGNDLSFTGTPTPANDRNNLTGGAYLFNSSAEFLQKTSATNLPSGSADRSMCAWLNVSNFTGNTYTSAIYYGSAVAGNGSGLDLDNNNRPSYNNYGTDLASPVVSTLGQWYHACAVNDATSKRVYVNGNLEISGSLTLTTSGTTLRLGNVVGGTSAPFSGTIDDARIYNRALSVAEIRELSGFAPGQLSGNTLWLDAGRAVFNDAGTTLATAAQTVQQWNDISFTSGTANAKHVNQATSGNRATWQSSVLNGQPVMRFDGIDDFLSRTSVTGSELFATNEASLFVVQKQAGVKTNNASVYWSNGATGRVVLHLTESDSLTFDFPSTGGTGRLSVTQPANWDDIFHLTEAYRSTTSAAELKVDGTLVGSGTRTGTLNTSLVADFYIGSSNGVSYYFQGDIAEVLIYKRGLTTTERDNITCYLGKKYAITVTGVVCD